jgi:hypothetical protein
MSFCSPTEKRAEARAPEQRRPRQAPRSRARQPASAASGCGRHARKATGAAARPACAGGGKDEARPSRALSRVRGASVAFVCFVDNGIWWVLPAAVATGASSYCDLCSAPLRVLRRITASRQGTRGSVTRNSPEPGDKRRRDAHDVVVRWMSRHPSPRPASSAPLASPSTARSIVASRRTTPRLAPG